MTNYFEALAQQQMVAATKARHRTAEKRAAAKVVQSEKDAPMKLSAAEQEVADQSTQLRAYKLWKREEIKALFAGPNGKQWLSLVGHVKAMTIENAPDVMAWILAQQWLLEAPLHERQIALGAVGGAIIQLRIANGQSPMDDSLPGEEPTMFEIIRRELKTET